MTEPVFLNYTKQKVKIRVPVSCWFDGKEFVEFEPQPMRTDDGFSLSFTQVGSIGGINFSVREVCDVCIPEETENVFLIVPTYIAEHPSLAMREDLVSLGPSIENEKGELIAYDGLTAGVGLERSQDKFFMPIA